MLVARHVPPEAQPEAARPCWAMWRNARTRVLLLSATYFRKPSNVEAPNKIENMYSWKELRIKHRNKIDFHRTRSFYTDPNHQTGLTKGYAPVTLISWPTESSSSFLPAYICSRLTYEYVSGLYSDFFTTVQVNWFEVQTGIFIIVVKCMV